MSDASPAPESKVDENSNPVIPVVDDKSKNDKTYDNKDSKNADIKDKDDKKVTENTGKTDKDDKDTKDKSKFIVISGITSGIGLGMLREFTKLGHKVAGFGRRSNKINEIKKELKITDKILLTSLDITKTEDILKWSQNIIKEHGCPDIMIHNAGSNIGTSKEVWNIDINKMTDSFNINVLGSIILIKSFVPSMIKNKSGIVINISSWAGINGYAGGTPYVTSKHSLEGIIKCLAKEFDELNEINGYKLSGICVSPGWVNTDMLKGSYEATLAEQMKIENGDEWAKKCCPWLLKLGLKHNGKSLGPKIENESMKKYCSLFGANVKDFIHPEN